MEVRRKKATTPRKKTVFPLVDRRSRYCLQGPHLKDVGGVGHHITTGTALSVFNVVPRVETWTLFINNQVCDKTRPGSDRESSLDSSRLLNPRLEQTGPHHSFDFIRFDVNSSWQHHTEISQGQRKTEQNGLA